MLLGKILCRIDAQVMLISAFEIACIFSNDRQDVDRQILGLQLIDKCVLSTLLCKCVQRDHDDNLLQTLCHVRLVLCRMRESAGSCKLSQHVHLAN